MIPLAAAAAAAVIAGTFAVAHLLPGTGRGPRPAGPKYATVPANYAYTVQGDIYNYTSHGTRYSAGVNGRYLKVRSTATGKLLATVLPPRPYDNFSLITADASGSVFVLGAVHDWQRYANALPRVYRRNQTRPMRFLELRIGPAGQVQQSSLSLPVTVTPAQLPSMVLSPEGTRLAVAFGGGGRPRRWRWSACPAGGCGAGCHRGSRGRRSSATRAPGRRTGGPWCSRSGPCSVTRPVKPCGTTIRLPRHRWT